MAICANCGKEIDEGAKFCTNCGAPVQHMQAPAQAEPLVPQDSPSQNINDSNLFDNNVTGDAGSAGSFGTAPDSGSDTFGTSAGTGSDYSGTSSDSAGTTYGSGTASYGTAPENAAVYAAGTAGRTAVRKRKQSQRLNRIEEICNSEAIFVFPPTVMIN